MRAVAVVVTLVAVSLSGCFGGSNDALDPRATDSASDLPTLPDGLEMEGAEIVEYNETSVVWRWEESIGPGALGPETDQGPRVTTTFDVPAKRLTGIEAVLTWPEVDTFLGLGILDEGGEEICRERRSPDEGIPGPYPPSSTIVRCHAATLPIASQQVWSVFVETRANARQEITFQLDLRLRIGPHPSILAHQQEARDERDGQTVVLGFGDSGINPYHVQFRADFLHADQHPSTYIEGYPEDAVALNLTLDAPNYEAAITADAEIWKTVEQDQLYWIPGTRIVGTISPSPTHLWGSMVVEPECLILDCDTGHGTMVASRGAGLDASLCPTCLIVMAQGGPASFEWLARADWVDVQSNSWVQPWEAAMPREDNDALAKRKPTFFAAGNGAGGILGVAGNPAAMWNHQGLPHAIAVGGHDNGRITTWSGSMPHVVADVCVMVARHDRVDGWITRVGTSHSTPYAASAAAQLVLDARRALEDHVGGVRDGVLARGSPSLYEEGPLSDGEFTTEELKRLLFTTADPRPGQEAAQDPGCGLDEWFAIPMPTAPVSWQTIPDDVPAYYFIGYGAVNEDTLEHAKRVLRGEETMPGRPVEDAFFALDQEIRKALVEVDP